MRNYLIFLKKELFESFKTFKLFVMGVVYLIFGMISPIGARFTPEIIKMALESDDSIDPSVVSALSNMPEPDAFESWAQFFNNIYQMGLIVLVIVFSGMLSSELSRGTLSIILTKGISRVQILLSKVTSAVLIWTGSLAVSFFTCFGYTANLFPETWGEPAPNLALAVLGLWVFGLFLIALTALFATLTKKGYVCMILVGTVVIVLNIIGIVPQTARYNPISLSSSWYAIITDASGLSLLYPIFIVTGVCIIAMITLAGFVFDKKRL